MDLTLKTADGAFNETLVAQIYEVWINEGTLMPAAVNEEIQGPYADNYLDDPRGDSLEDEMGLSESVGALSFG